MPAAGQGMQGYRMMRCPEWTAVYYMTGFIQKPRHTVHLRYLYTLLKAESRKYRRDTSGYHGFACPGGACHEYVVHSRRGYLHSTFKGFMPHYLREIHFSFIP